MLKQADAGYNERLFAGGIRSSFHLSRFKWVNRNVRRYVGLVDSVVELGCFDGRALNYLPSPPRRYVGFDANWEGGLDIAKQRWQSQPMYTFHQCANATTMTSILGPARFEIALCLETFEHIQPEMVVPYLDVLATITERYLFITVPMEMGPVFLAKYSIKRLLGDQDIFTFREIVGAALGRMDWVCRREHKGFDHREFLGTLCQSWDILSVSGYPCKWLPGPLCFGIGIVASPRSY